MSKSRSQMLAQRALDIAHLGDRAEASGEETREQRLERAGIGKRSQDRAVQKVFALYVRMLDAVRVVRINAPKRGKKGVSVLKFESPDWDVRARGADGLRTMLGLDTATLTRSPSSGRTVVNLNLPEYARTRAEEGRVVIEHDPQPGADEGADGVHDGAVADKADAAGDRGA